METSKHDYRALAELTEEAELYGEYLILSVLDGIAKNLGVTVPQKLEKASALMAALRKMKGILGRLSKLSPSMPLEIAGKPIYVKGKVLTVKAWKAIEDKIRKHLDPKLRDLSEELTARTFLLAMANTEAELQGQSIKDKSFAEIEREKFDGAMPNDIQGIQERFKLSKDLKDQLHTNQFKVAEYITDMSDQLRKAVKAQILDAYEKGKSRDELVSDLYWAKEDATKKVSREILDRNWRRVVNYETSSLHENIRLAATEDLARTKPVYYVFGGSGHACDYCQKSIGKIVRQIPANKVGDAGDDKLSLRGIEDEYTDTAIWTGKNNVGRRQADWWICCPVHPSCKHHLFTINPARQEYNARTFKVETKKGSTTSNYFDTLMKDDPIFREIEDNYAAAQRRRDQIAKEKTEGTWKKPKEKKTA